jgi:hypothetical protein
MRKFINAVCLIGYVCCELASWVVAVVSLLG